MRHLEENKVVEEGTSGYRPCDDEDELLETNTKTFRSQSEIVAKVRHQREEVLR